MSGLRPLFALNVVAAAGAAGSKTDDLMITQLAMFRASTLLYSQVAKNPAYSRLRCCFDLRFPLVR